MNITNKSLLAAAALALLAVPCAQAQGRGRGSAPLARPSVTNSRQASSGYSSAFNRAGRYRGRGYDGRGYGGHGRGRYYYLGGVPYFYPYGGFGFGYPGYYGDGFGFGYESSFYGGGYGYPAYGYNGNPAYEGRIVEETVPGGSSSGGQSLPAAVQRQLAKRGYYKGEIDGEFGSGSRSALRRFQRDHRLEETGRIDESTLNALGFGDRR